MQVERDLDLSRDFETLPENPPYACLSAVVNTVSARRWITLVDKYGLTSSRSNVEGVVHFDCKQLRMPSHKHEAIVLFVSALEAIVAGLLQDVSLYEVNRLRPWLASAMNLSGEEFESCGNVVEAGELAGCCWICESTAMHLRQAGFVLPDAGGAVALTFIDCQTLFRELTEVATSVDEFEEECDTMLCACV